MIHQSNKQCNSDRALISRLSWSELRSYAKFLNLSAKGTRAEIELRILMADEVPMDNNQDVLSQSERIDAVERELCDDNEEYNSLSQEEKNELIRERLVTHHYLGEKWLRSDWSFNFESAKFAEPKKTQPQAPKTPGKPAKVVPMTPGMTPGKKAATMSPVPQGVTLALANLARALKHSSNGIAIFSDTFKVVAITQHFPETYPGIWKAEFQGSVIGYLQKNDGTYTGYKECPVREPDMDSPNGKFWVDAQGNGEFKVSRVVVTKLSQKTSVHIVTTNSSHQGGISCDCQGFAYRQHCCHIEAVNTVLRPQEQITQKIEALKIRADLIQKVRDRKLWNLLNLIEPSVLNASLKEIEEGNQILQNALQDALQDAFNVSQIA